MNPVLCLILLGAMMLFVTIGLDIETPNHSRPDKRLHQAYSEASSTEDEAAYRHALELWNSARWDEAIGFLKSYEVKNESNKLRIYSLEGKMIQSLERAKQGSFDFELD